MPDDLKSLIDASLVRLWNSESDEKNAAIHIRNLGDQIAAQNWSGAQTECDSAATYLEAFQLVTVPWPPNGTHSDITNALYWINDNWPSNGPVEVTMSAILTAMVTASFDELRYFIGLIDAYRVALMNKPFNSEFYAALARGFTE